MRFHTAALVLMGCTLSCGALELRAAEQTYSLREERPAGSLARVKVDIHTEGNLKLNASGKQVTQLPLTVAATLTYDERTLPAAAKQPLRRVRYYAEAQADIRVGNEKQQSRLRDEARIILLNIQDDDVTLLAPSDPLSREELELIDSPANSAVLAGVLPTGPVKIGDTWQPSNAALAQLLNIEVVLKNEAKATLKSVDDELAKLELNGKVDGSACGIATHFELTAKYTFDRRQKQISWFAVSLKENRSIGHAEPGYDVTSQVKVLIAPLKECPELSDKVVATLPTDIHAGQSLLRFDSAQANFRLFHDRRWRMMIDRPDLVVFRFIDRGDLVAQCNVTRLSAQPKDKHLSVASFQDEVKKALDKHFEQFIDTAASTTSNGAHVLRITAMGKVADLPIHWIYYHITGPDGRCYSCVITLEQKLMERFGGADQSLVDTFEFLPEPERKVADAPAAGAAEEKSGGTGEKNNSAASPNKNETGPELPAALKKSVNERR